MKLKIINSNSAGNCYLLESSTGEVLMLECGVRFPEILKALNFEIGVVCGCLVTHSHKDHCKAVNDLMLNGITVYATHGEQQAMDIHWRHNAITVSPGYNYSVGSFLVQPFKVIHDSPEPVGYLIKHDECGIVLFLTDTVYSPYAFKGLNNIIVEANYCENIIDKKMKESGNKFVRDRVLQSHMSIQNCKDLLKANDLTRVNNIVLIHLSDAHSDERHFKKEVQDLTGKTVHVADKNMVIDFGKSSF